METSTALIVAMVVVMVAMCGGMMAGAAWAMVRRRRDRSDQ
jgi:ABC-type dipeptide/oligopeptide/nickel transport system permease subunit